MEKFNYPIGKQIADVRNRRKISQKDLAKRIGITQQALSKIEQGDSEPRESTIIALVRELDDVLGRNDLHIHLPKYESVEDLAKKVNDKYGSGLFLKSFVYELCQINNEFQQMLNDIAYKKIVKRGKQMKDIFDDFDDETEIIQDLENIDGFNVEKAIRENKTPSEILVEWYKHEGVTDLSVDFGFIFSNWNERTFEDKFETINLCKKLADKDIKE